MRRVAILPDHQGVALDSADWSAVRDLARVDVFREHVPDTATAAALRATRSSAGCANASR